MDQLAHKNNKKTPLRYIFFTESDHFSGSVCILLGLVETGSYTRKFRREEVFGARETEGQADSGSHLTF